MIESYLTSAIRQAQERARVLKGKISRPVQHQELVALHLTCQDRIDRAINDLETLRADTVILRHDLEHERIRLFRRALADLSLLETTAIAALTRSHDDDAAMSKLVFQIHKEVGYPLPPPTVTCLSNDYFSISPSLRLLFVPLAEADFLLHLPDLYHELAHLLIATRNNPVIEPFQQEFGKFLMLITNYFATERAANARLTGPREYFGKVLDQLEYCWVRDWANEIFCDLFAIYTLGPAYAWAHFHLTAGHDVDPYEVEIPGFMSHPPDEARMEAMLIGLDLLGLKKEATDIQEKWDGLLKATGVAPTPLYRRACPRTLLEQVAVGALEGTKKIRCCIVTAGTTGPIRDLLNTAWVTFWAAPDDYHIWERGAIAKLRQGA